MQDISLHIFTIMQIKTELILCLQGYSKTFLLKQFSIKALTKTIDIVLQSSSTGLALISTTWSVTLIRCTISYKVSRTYNFKNCCFVQNSIQLCVSMLQQQIYERYQLCKNGKHLDLRSRISPPKSLSQKQLTPSCTPAYAQPLPSQKSRHSSIVNSRSDKTVPFISLMSTLSW